ncbi:Phosphate transport system permease protein PstA [Paraglaciecola mesophila]|uniref:Phosphate transport system permease protein PstA n=1 Tax=Paraglaciecola mesophila TaxID=197222 RepID=A0A857JNA0_9ALTE|nr:phosphate ABC transporter permease PstA [Paraglaciecola mesophila]QHJ13353.1 Phosphate transport system permease protein PstA [Paraglaciecola mesophila]
MRKMNHKSATRQQPSTIELVNRNLAKRKRAEWRFRVYGIGAILFGFVCLLILFTDIVGKGHGAFFKTQIQLQLSLDSESLQVTNPSSEQLENANYDAVIENALLTDNSALMASELSALDKRQLLSLVSTGAVYDLQKMLIDTPEQLNHEVSMWLTADDDVDNYVKSRTRNEQGFSGRLTEQQQKWVDRWLEQGQIRQTFNTTFFTSGDSREPEQAGIRGALMGSLYMLLVTIGLSFPIGISAAVYLEEYAPRNRLTDFIEVNINNLAAVPSIIFGLLGLAIFIGFFDMPRSIPLVGGLVLTLMTLPTIIISSRAAIKAVPQSIRDAAYGLGASKMQVVLHHVVPLAMPGMLTGAIIGFAQALGETAPLLMIGMVAFIVDVPADLLDPASALPVQIFLWADSPERAFIERTSAAIMVLLAFLIAMNGLAVWLRHRLGRGH